MRTFKGEIRYLFDSSFVAFLAGNLSTVVTSAGKAAETTNIPRDFGVGGTGQGDDNGKDGKLHIVDTVALDAVKDLQARCDFQS
jgi:hypothetical protein